MTPRLAKPTLSRHLVFLLGAVLACGPGRGLPTEASQGKTASDAVTVTAATPPSAPRDTTLDVQVTGTGFDRGSQAVFTLDGVVDPRVRVNATRYVKATTLVANVTVATDAVPERYDVMVTTSRGKKGIGTELFAVLAINAIPMAGSAHGINAAGQVVGGTGNGPYVWSAEAGTAALPVPGGMSGGSAYAIATGHIVGSSILASGRNVPVRWTEGPTGWSVRALDPGPTGSSIPLAVNASGVAAGWVILSGQGSRAVRWDAADRFAFLPTLSCGFSTARAINAEGTIVGTASGGPDCHDLPAIWPSGGGVVSAPLPAGYDAGHLFGINSAGMVVGYVYRTGTSSTNRAALWRPDPARPGTWLEPILLGSLGGPNEARAVSDADQVVGYSMTSSSAPRRPFYWTAGGGMRELAVWGSAWAAEAEGISPQSGRVVGRSYTPSKTIGVWWPLP